MYALNVWPWPSVYNPLGETAPKKIKSEFGSRPIGAVRVAIPPRTIEPPQVHLICPRDELPFEELLIDLDRPMTVFFYDFIKRIYRAIEYSPGEDIQIPPFQIHWLANLNSEHLAFTCEFAPSPWKGEIDEPEFPDLNTLLD